MVNVEYELWHHIMSSHQLAVIPNFYLLNFECDLFVLNNNMYTTEYEIKKSKADFKNDFLKGAGNLYTKHELISSGKRTNRFVFVVPKGMDLKVPDYCGIIEFTEHRSCVYFETKRHAKRLHNRKFSGTSQCLSILSNRFYMLTRMTRK